VGFPRAFHFGYILKPFIFSQIIFVRAFLSLLVTYFQMVVDLSRSFLRQVYAFQQVNPMVFKEGYEDWLFSFLLGLPRDFKFHPILSVLAVCWE
jgi:hypothetical protein